jgi:hypothetical protein
MFIRDLEQAKGTVQPSFVSRLLSNVEPNMADETKAKDGALYEDLVRYNTGAMFGGKFFSLAYVHLDTIGPHFL